MPRQVTSRFDGGYIRGGRNSLYLTRQDIVEAIKVVAMGCGLSDAASIFAEAMYEVEEEEQKRQLNWEENTDVG